MRNRAEADDGWKSWPSMNIHKRQLREQNIPKPRRTKLLAETSTSTNKIQTFLKKKSFVIENSTEYQGLRNMLMLSIWGFFVMVWIIIL